MPRLFLLCLLVACGSGGGFPDARPIDAAPPKGTFTLDWAVSDANGNTVTCDQLGANVVSVVTHNRAVDGASTQVFNCSTLMGMSTGLDPGTYDLDFELDGSSVTLATSPSQHGIVIESDQNVRLAPLAFSVVATGAVALNLSTGRAGGNCAMAPGGGGITTQQITLTRNSDLACNPLVLTIGTGAGHPTPTTYTINCTTPMDAPCIENDQSLTATGVAADSYTIHIAAKQGAVTCWNNNDSIVVPPLGATLTRQLNLGFATAGCM
ncbi:MAG: hypothetical protein ABI591_09615 [Kofleriaceae bacterium]